MQRESTSKPRKAQPEPESPNKMTLESASVWGTPTKRPEPTAPAPTWSRYVDSRLKQFCTR
jgi:hypothetical protein